MSGQPETPQGALVDAANAFADMCRQLTAWLKADSDLRERRDRRLSPERPGR